MTDDEILENVMDMQVRTIQSKAKAAQAKANKLPPATGYCLFCEEPLPPGERFCDADCAHDGERYGLVTGVSRMSRTP